ncbi:hypothetical protein V1525DRAFT_409008 [Lipomyces kononenkoae]|uniref:Uncharacterized protein n=1 Tax=Lipomyces kononenkoae TaxID=34357 RepID=A0ACC3SVW3_LIPKO
MSSVVAIGNSQETVVELQAEIDESHNQINRYENELARLSAKVEELERLHEVQEEEIHSRDIEIEDMKEDTKKLTHENANLKEELAVERRNFAELQLTLEDHERRLVVQDSNQSLPPASTEDESNASAVTIEFSSSDRARYEKEIENLRIDLAELHLKAVAAEKTYEEELRNLRQDIVDARIQNGNLLKEVRELESLVWEKARSESNESATVDDMPETMEDTGLSDLKAATTLAEEILASSPIKTYSQDLEKENQELRESNIAMATYIERIIEKLLDNKALEHILEHSSPTKESKRRSRTTQTRLPTKTLADRRDKKQVIGIGINFESTLPSIDEPGRAHMSPRGAFSPRSIASLSPGLPNPLGSTSPSAVNQRRVSSGGQKSLLPLKLSEGITSPRQESYGTTPDSPQCALYSPPLGSNGGSGEKPTTANGSGKRSSWLGIFTTASSPAN